MFIIVEAPEDSSVNESRYSSGISVIVKRSAPPREVFVVSEIDLAHAADAEATLDPVATDLRRGAAAKQARACGVETGRQGEPTDELGVDAPTTVSRCSL